MPPKNLERLKELLKVANEGLNKDEFIKAFQGVLSFVLKIQKDLETRHLGAMNEMSAILNDLKQQAQNLSRGLNEKVDKKLSVIKEGKDGKTPIKGVDYFDGLRGVDGRTPVKGVDYFDGKSVDINTIKEQVTVDSIKGLREEIDRVQREARMVARTRIVAGPPATAIRGHTITGIGNGARTFTVPLHSEAILLVGSQFPFVYLPDVDFTTSNTRLTLTAQVAAPEDTQSLRFVYRK